MLSLERKRLHKGRIALYCILQLDGLLGEMQRVHHSIPKLQFTVKDFSSLESCMICLGVPEKCLKLLIYSWIKNTKFLV